jgi:hypothetical protein
VVAVAGSSTAIADGLGEILNVNVKEQVQVQVQARLKSRLTSWVALTVCLTSVFSLSGCGVAAAPCRIASAGLKIVPLIGHIAAAPTDVCADVIDP